MSFTNYTPQLSWEGHDMHLKRGISGTLGAAKKSAKISLPGSLVGQIKMMNVPSGNINTDERKPADKTASIKRGGL